MKNLTEIEAAVTPPAVDTTPVASGGGDGSGSLGVFSLLLALSLWLRRQSNN